MNKLAAEQFILANKGEAVVITKTDGSLVVPGTALSVNSKGVNIKTDAGRTVSISLTRIASMVLADDTDPTDEDIEAGLMDGMTTAQLADVFGIEAKELRVHLRALGLGVGKGRKYSLAVADYRAVKALVAAN